MTPPSSARKRPHCRSCGSPMAGHKRQRGYPICPTAPTSPPPSPFPHQDPLAPPAGRQSECSFVIPTLSPGKVWHYQNPNWVDRPLPASRPPPSPRGSLVPTVLVDEDGNTVRGSNHGDDGSQSVRGKWEYEEGEGVFELDDEDCGDTVSPEMRMEELAELGQPVVSIFNAHREDIPRIRHTAAKLGVHTGVVHSPTIPSAFSSTNPAGSTDSRTKNKDRTMLGVARQGSWWLVLGQNADLIGRIVDAQQRGMPGTVAEDVELAEYPRMVTFLQLVVAGLIGGCIVVGGLAML